MSQLTFEEYRNRIVQIDPNKNCPVQSLIGILSKKWNLRVIFELTKCDLIRFGALKKQLGNITNASLSTTLKDLEDHGFVSRTQFNEIPPHVEYALTEKEKCYTRSSLQWEIGAKDMENKKPESPLIGAMLRLLQHSSYCKTTL